MKTDLLGFFYPPPKVSSGISYIEKKLMDNQESQNVAKKPFLFGDIELELIVRMVKEPRYDEIVWNVDK